MAFDVDGFQIEDMLQQGAGTVTSAFPHPNRQLLKGTDSDCFPWMQAKGRVTSTGLGASPAPSNRR